MNGREHLNGKQHKRDYRTPGGTMPSCERCNGTGTLCRCRRCGTLYRHIHKYSDCGNARCEGEKSDDVPCPDCCGKGDKHPGTAGREATMSDEECPNGTRFHRGHLPSGCVCLACGCRLPDPKDAELDRLRAALAAAERERDELRSEVAQLKGAR